MIEAAILIACQDRQAGWVDLPGPEMPAVSRTTRYPLSDQGNVGGWTPYDALWDEFGGTRLDRKKWHDHNPGWNGRQPAFFSPKNVEVKDGKLHLTMRRDDPPEELRREGYHTFSSAAVQSVGTVLYGYFEIKARPMRSHGSSAFWFYRSTPEIWTEIDVFEIGGGAPGFERKDHMNVHVFHTPSEKEHWAIPGVWEADRPLADSYLVYGLDWSNDEIRFFGDGALVRKGPNTHWHQPLTLNFDSETMPDWFGLPRVEDLPSTFSIEYVRAWKRQNGAKRNALY
ncbi:MAG TPA: family 16 glycosylhydrolase [Fimbriimonas sp.]